MSDVASTVSDGEEGPLEDREDGNHGSRENELSGPKPVPSAPPGRSISPCEVNTLSIVYAIDATSKPRAAEG